LKEGDEGRERMHPVISNVDDGSMLAKTLPFQDSGMLMLLVKLDVL
jgi:hypothetical protein